jgi:hypothetical protein
MPEKGVALLIEKAEIDACLGEKGKSRTFHTGFDWCGT